MSIYIFRSTERFVPVTTRKERAYQKNTWKKKTGEPQQEFHVTSLTLSTITFNHTKKNSL